MIDIKTHLGMPLPVSFNMDITGASLLHTLIEKACTTGDAAANAYWKGVAFQLEDAIVRSASAALG